MSTLETQTQRVANSFPTPNALALAKAINAGRHLDMHLLAITPGTTEGGIATIHQGLTPTGTFLRESREHNALLSAFIEHGNASGAVEAEDGSIKFGTITVVDNPQGVDVSKPVRHGITHITTRATLYPSTQYAALIRDYYEASQGGLLYDSVLHQLALGMTAEQHRSFKVDPDAFVAGMRDRLNSQQ